MRTSLIRFPLFCLLMLGVPVMVQSGPGTVTGNSVDFDPPPKDGKNPDSPVAGTILATGFSKSANNWNCTKYEVTVKELVTMKEVDFKTAKGGPTWKYASKPIFTSNVTHSVGIVAHWSGPLDKTDTASATQTVLVK